MVYSYYGKGRIQETSIGKNIAFAYHKVQRLYPLYIFATLIMFVGSFVAGTNIYTAGMAVVRLISNIIIIQEYLPFLNQSICGVAWYLCVATLSYFLFPWILKRMEHCWSVRKAVITIGGVAILIGLAGILGAQLVSMVGSNESAPGTVWSYDQHWFTYKFPLVRMLDVIIGYNLGYIYLHVQHNRSERDYTVLEVGALAVTIVMMVICYRTRSAGSSGVELWWRSALIQLVSSVMLVYGFAIGRGVISNTLARMKSVMYLARISPYTFMMHYFIFYAIYVATVVAGSIPGLSWLYEIGDHSLPLLKLLLGFPLTIVATEIWIHLEKRIRRMIVARA